MEILPNDTGLFWCKRDYSCNWNYIISVKGKSPFLTYSLWDLINPSGPNNGKSNLPRSLTHVFAMDSKIDIVETDKKIIQASKPGLYLLSGKCTTLAVVIGTSPYMRCYTWEIETDVRKKHDSPWLLPFLKYIERPKTKDDCNVGRISVATK